MPHGAVPDSDCVLFRDGNDIGLEVGVKPAVGANSYAEKLRPPAFVLCEKDIWEPQEDIAEEELAAEDVTAAERRKRARKAASTYLKRRINAVRVACPASPQPCRRPVQRPPAVCLPTASVKPLSRARWLIRAPRSA